MRSPVAELLADLAAALAAVNVEWFLFGAQAAIAYGVARLTADVDVTVRVPERMPNRVWVDALRTHGFQPRFEDPAFVDRGRVVPLVHRETGLPVDVVLAGPGLEDDFFARVAVHDFEGVAVPIVDAGDLVVMKVLADRPKDLEDVITLLKIQEATIDLARVRQTLGVLESALGQSDLIPALDAAVARSKSRG